MRMASPIGTLESLSGGYGSLWRIRVAGVPAAADRPASARAFHGSDDAAETFRCRTGDGGADWWSANQQRLIRLRSPVMMAAHGPLHVGTRGTGRRASLVIQRHRRPHRQFLLWRFLPPLNQADRQSPGSHRWRTQLGLRCVFLSCVRGIGIPSSCCARY